MVREASLLKLSCFCWSHWSLVLGCSANDGIDIQATQVVLFRRVAHPQTVGRDMFALRLNVKAWQAVPNKAGGPVMQIIIQMTEVVHLKMNKFRGQKLVD